MPSVSKLLERARDKRFENNLELYLQKPSNVALLKPQATKTNHLLRHYLRGAPSFWFQFRETQSVPLNLRQRLWWQHLNHIYKNKTDSIDLLVAELSKERPGKGLLDWELLAENKLPARNIFVRWKCLFGMKWIFRIDPRSLLLKKPRFFKLFERSLKREWQEAAGD